MGSLANRQKEVDTYHKMRSDEPVKYGEYLCELSDKGLSQKEIAELLKTNRQLVGRYQRIGKWPNEVKTFIEGHRKFISNTAILNASMSPSSTESLLEAFKKLATDPKKQDFLAENMGELRTLPTATAFSAALVRLSEIEQQLADMQELANSRHVHLDESNTDSDTWSWRAIFERLLQPGTFLLLICIMGITSYLIHQGAIFFSVIEPDYATSVSSAVMSEVIPLLSTVCLVLSRERLRKMIAATILMVTIVGLGFFMYTSLADRMAKQSGSFVRLAEDRSVLLSTIGALQASMEALPENLVTKRQQLAEQITKEQTKLSGSTSALTRSEVQRVDINSVGLTYSVWLRVAAMALNAFLVHLFLSQFLRRRKSLGLQLGAD